MATPRAIEYSSLVDSLGGRELVLVGSGSLLKRTEDRLASHGLGCSTTLAPDVISAGSENLRDRLLVICDDRIDELSAALCDCGFRPNADFVITPALNVARLRRRLFDTRSTLLLVSGQDSGGGLFRVEIGTRIVCTCVLAGPCHGICSIGQGYLVSHGKQVLLLDTDLAISATTTLQDGARAHGITATSEQVAYAIDAQNDALIELELPTMRVARRISLAKGPAAQHHYNDVLVDGESLLVTLFSLCGGWTRQQYDGALVRVHLNRLHTTEVVIDDLRFPHGPFRRGTDILVLDSLRGQMRSITGEVLAAFPGFVRGISSDGACDYIGLSRHRRHREALQYQPAVSMDTSVVIYLREEGIYRTIVLSEYVQEIHGLLVLP